MKTILKKSKGYLLVILLSFSFFYIWEKYSYNSSIDNVIETMQKGFKGVVKGYYSGNPHKEKTHLIIDVQDKEIMILPAHIIVEKATLGDSIIKPKNENLIILKKQNQIVFRHFYKLISDETRNHPDWPKEWRGKWMDATLEWRRVFGKEASKE